MHRKARLRSGLRRLPSLAGLRSRVVEPAEAINLVETVLRQAAHAVLKDAWQEHVDLDDLKRRRLEESKSRNGAVVEADLLAYTHLYELEKIVDRRWEQFKPILKDKKRFTVYMDRLKDFRNAPMHSRTLLPFERELLAGIAGEIRNSFTIWRSEQAPDMTWYPRVESIIDSFGNDLTPKGDDAALMRAPVRLRPGQIVEFRCAGWDPQDRQLGWTLSEQAGSGALLDEREGSEATLRWEVSKAHVADPFIVLVQMRAVGAQYHRQFGTTDATISLFYSVDPPTP